MSQEFSANLPAAPVRQSENSLGIAGFVISLLGIVTCGLIAPVGLLLSLLALFKRPRGFATAGTVIGLLGSVWLALAGFLLIAGALGLKSAAESVVEELGPAATTYAAVTNASHDVLDYRKEHGDWPNEDLGQEIADQYEDGYGTPLRYTRVGDMVLIISAGKDREFATPDDMSLDPNQAPERGSVDWDD